MPPVKEIQYLDSLVRGVYARRDLPEGHTLTDDDVYLAVPLLRGQISCRELMSGEVLLHALGKDEAIMIDDIDSPYANIPSLRERIYSRGLDAAERVLQLPANFVEGPPIVVRANGEAESVRFGSLGGCR
jgi:N-acetylneuraminate synthase